jgi:hypothetical protein
MKRAHAGSSVATLCLLVLGASAAHAARDSAHDKIEVRAYVSDACIVADEPYFIPVSPNKDGADQAKFLPLIGLVVGKLAELFINHEIQASVSRMQGRASRKDTHYAVRRQMNLYRATFEPAPGLGINSKLGCMTIVAAGTFKPEPADCTAEYVPKELAKESVGQPQNQWKTSRADDSVENQLRRANVCVVGKASAVYESRFEFSNDGTAFRLRDAGYRIESLLTTQDKAAARTTLYTLKVSDPGATDQEEVLVTAWVNIGAVTAGSHATGASADSAPWLRVPPLTVEARRKFDQDTRIQQEASGEIEALKRAMARNRRVLASLDQRIAAASPELAEGLKQERLRIAVQDQSQGAELDARNAEYQELPHAPLEYMPVTIEVAVTETESEDKARLALADIIGKTGDTVASSVGGSATALLSKSVSAADIKTEPDAASPTDDLTRAREQYFDAMVDAQTHTTDPAHQDAELKLGVAKQKYNQARRTQGLEPIE